MGKPVIAIDIDDTLFEHFIELAAWHNARYGTELGLADNHPKGSEALLRWKAETIEEAVRRVHGFYDTVEFREATPHKEALSVIERMAGKYDIAFVTARDIEVLESFTHEWLERHLKGLYREVHFTAQYSLSGQSRTKLEVCREIGASILIDDSLENCIDMVNDGRIGLLFGDYPWNSSYDGRLHNLIRVQDWSAVEREIERIANE